MADSADLDFYQQKIADMLKLAEIASSPAARLEFMRLAEEYRGLCERLTGERAPNNQP